MTDKTATVDIFGEFGFRVVWSYNEHVANVKVYEMVAHGMDAAKTPMFNRDGWANSSDVVLDIAQAEVYLEGFLKWDGCSEISQGHHHYCGEQGLIKHCMLLNYLWQRAHQLLEASDFRAKTN